MCNRKRTFNMADCHRLAVLDIYAARCRIANVTDSYPAVLKFAEIFLVEHLVDQADALSRLENSAFIYDDAAAFLTSVLERIESKIRQGSHIFRLVGINTEHAAFFMNITGQKINSFPFPAPDYSTGYSLPFQQ